MTPVRIVAVIPRVHVPWASLVDRTSFSFVGFDQVSVRPDTSIARVALEYKHVHIAASERLPRSHRISAMPGWGKVETLLPLAS